MPRNLSGEAAVVASSIHLRKDVYTPGGITTSLQSIYELSMLLERPKTSGGLDEGSDDPCSQQLIATFVRGLHDLCRLKAELVPVAEISGLGSFLSAWRLITSNHFAQIFLADNAPNTYFNLLDRLNLLSPNLRVVSHHLYHEEPTMLYAPGSIQKTFHRRSTHTAIHSDQTHYYAPQAVNKSYYRRSNHFSIEPEHHTWLNVTIAASEYTLENADPNGLSRGGVVLKKDGVVVSTIQVVPDPTNQQQMLLSVDSAGTPFYNNAGAHTAAHGSFGGSGSGDNFIGSLDFLSSTGHIRAITTPNQVTVTTPPVPGLEVLYQDGGRRFHRDAQRLHYGLERFYRSQCCLRTGAEYAPRGCGGGGAHLQRREWGHPGAREADPGLRAALGVLPSRSDSLDREGHARGQ